MTKNINAQKSKIDEVDVHVGAMLRTKRVLLGLSQHDLAKAVGVSIQQIQKYEKADNRVASGRLYYFARYLKVSVNYFFDAFTSSKADAKESWAFEEEQDQFLLHDSLPEKDVIKLIKEFRKIKDMRVRKKIIELVGML